MSSAAPVGLFVGLTTMDFVFGVDGYPQRNTKNIVSEVGLFAGGPAANAAVAFAALGGRSRLQTVIGRHPLTGAIRDDLERRQVELLDRAPGHAGLPPLASIVVSRPGGDRTVLSTASTGLPPTEFEPRDFAPRPDVVLIDAHLLAQCLAAARHARAQGVPVVYDAGHWKPGLEPVCEAVDYAVCSDAFFPPGCRSGEETLAWLAAKGVPYRAITRGELPIVWQGPDGACEIPVEAIDAADTLGAGDFFHGAFSFAIASGASFTDALREGARVATLSCRSFGTRAWLESLRR
ncbi:MAG: sugar kinase [Acidobacteria bacterium]|nr:sugar kinase [Acidobacteriota bacterium]